MAEVKYKYKIVIEQSKNNMNSAQRIIFNAVARRLRAFKVLSLFYCKSLLAVWRSYIS